MYNKFVVTGKIIGETDTHYITETPRGKQSWHKNWYRLMPEIRNKNIDYNEEIKGA